MRIVSLASGSKGNAYLVGHEGAWLLIDDGLPYKVLSQRWKPYAPTLVGILVTHDHTDHVGGIATLLKHAHVPVFANAATAEAASHVAHIDPDAFMCFENGQDFNVGPFSVHPFSIPHDTADPVGYLVKAGGETYFHGTDIGTPLDSIGVHLGQADVATLESNHDPVLLKTSGRPLPLIQRIAGPRGHLANEQSADMVRRFASPRLKRLALAHLSRDCNAPHLAEQSMREVLGALGRVDMALTILSQDDVYEV